MDSSASAGVAVREYPLKSPFGEVELSQLSSAPHPEGVLTLLSVILSFLRYEMPSKPDILTFMANL
jgi:hypothetical protein